ncbi:MAG: hypothetical protein KBG09_06265 [Syntrophobacterales bacterium]|nr:hypothetical protein [Syntrophobacterales bacterium]
MKRFFIFFMLVFIIAGATLTFNGCAGTREKSREKAGSEETYRNAADFERAQDRQRLDHGGY